MENRDINLRDHLHLLETVEGINEIGKLIALKYWDLDFDIPIIINRRLTRTYARFISKYVRGKDNKVIGHEAECIEISGRSFNNFTKYAMLDLLKHEICHWACLKLGRPNSDGSKFFESELRRINSSSTRVNMMEKGYRNKK